MQQLSGADTTFLYAEQGNTFNHVAALAIYDPSSHPAGKVRFKDILAHFEARLDSHPVFRRRLVETPFGLDRPYWVEDAHVDVEFHVRHIALPEPGDWRQLMIQVARLHSRPLDRSRPLWEVYVIERLDQIAGLPPRSFALFSKFHHASVDGMAALHLLGGLHSASPLAKDPSPRPSWRRREPQLAGLELAARSVLNSTGRALAMARLGASMVSRVSELARGPDAAESLFAMLPSGPRAPRTRFSDTISAHRVVEGTGLPLAAIKALRARVEGITINDVFLAVAGGAMRNYLRAKNELPSKPMYALMPISLRSDGAAGGNDTTGVPVSIGSEVADPLERLRVVHRASRKSMSDADLLGRDLLKQVLEVAPTAVSEMVLRRVVLPQLNTAVSNVRGPDGPLYLTGAELVRLYPVSIATDHVGINHTAVSYGGQFWIGVVSCRLMLPDPAFYMECLRGAFAEMLAAAGLPGVDDAAFTNRAAVQVAPPHGAKRANARR